MLIIRNLVVHITLPEKLDNTRANNLPNRTRIRSFPRKNMRSNGHERAKMIWVGNGENEAEES